MAGSSLTGREFFGGGAEELGMVGSQMVVGLRRCILLHPHLAVHQHRQEPVPQGGEVLGFCVQCLDGSQQRMAAGAMMAPSLFDQSHPSFAGVLPRWSMMRSLQCSKLTAEAMICGGI